MALGCSSGLARTRSSAEPYFLIVFAATGGASIIDSLLAIRESECSTPLTINCFPDGMVSNIPGSPFRAVDGSFEQLATISYSFDTQQSAFVQKHHEDMLVATLEGTSVTHPTAQRRAVTGNEAWSGRTLQELVAEAYGGDRLIPNAHLVKGTGFTERGSDPSTPDWARGEMIADPLAFPLALDGSRGTVHAPARDALASARAVRNERLDPASDFVRAFGESPRLHRWWRSRDQAAMIEDADLITNLMLLPDSPDLPLADHGLSASPLAAEVADAFPRLTRDPLELQAAMAYALLRSGVSVTATIGPSFELIADGDVGGGPGGGGGLPAGALINPPLGFDFAHSGHRSTQAMMWDRVYGILDPLIDLLRGHEFRDGQSLWDRTLIYVATDFGRSKERPTGASEFASAHDANNGALIISPLVRGNTVLGGVNPDTGRTYGFDLATGEPDPGRQTSESELFAGILQSLGVDTSGVGLPDVAAMRPG